MWVFFFNSYRFGTNCRKKLGVVCPEQTPGTWFVLITVCVRVYY